MITVEDDGVNMFLDIMETSIEEKSRIKLADAENLLKTRTMNFTLKAYGNLMNLTKEDITHMLLNIGSDHPISVEPLKARLEEGFRRCYSLEAVERLRKQVNAALNTDFTVAEVLALKYLPDDTAITAKIYLTIDAFNPGMVRGSDIGLSILSDLERLDMRHLAHELHHVGYINCISRRPGLDSIYINPRTPEEVAVQLVLHLVSEGLANHYCTPEMVKTGETKPLKVNTKIRLYEENLEPILQEAWGLLVDSLNDDELTGELKTRLRGILIDEESILPKVHFLGERIISMLDEDPEVSLKEIIELCNHPEQLVQLYNLTSTRYHLPKIPEAYVWKLLQSTLKY